MYEAFFGLQREPFSIAPDPQFLFLGERHREALALLSYGLARGASFVLLTGAVGAGKTTVWRRFLEGLPSNVDVANVVNDNALHIAIGTADLSRQRTDAPIFRRAYSADKAVYWRGLVPDNLSVLEISVENFVYVLRRTANVGR